MNRQTVLDLILCIIEAALLFFFIYSILENKRAKRFNGILFVLNCMVHSSVIFLINPLPVIIKMPISVLLFLSLCLLNFKESLLVTIGSVSYAFYVIVASDIICADMISVIQRTNIFSTITSYDESTIILSFISKFINLIVFYISIKSFKKINKSGNMIYHFYLDFIFVCFLIIAIVFVTLYPIVRYDSHNMLLFLILSSVFFITSFLILKTFVALCDYFSKEKYWTFTSIKYDSLKNQMDMQKEYIESSNKIRHDLKKLIETINYFNDNKKYDSLTAFLKDLTLDTYSYKTISYCNNEYINAVLNLKSKECELGKIKLSTHILPTLECGLSSDDIVLILSNLLDNAIEAVSKTRDEKKEITIKIYNYEKNLIIYCENKYIPNCTKTDFFQSDKFILESEIHGYGIQIIKELVNKNGGRCSFEYNNDNLFQATIMLPNTCQLPFDGNMIPFDEKHLNSAKK